MYEKILEDDGEIIDQRVIVPYMTQETYVNISKLNDEDRTRLGGEYYYDPGYGPGYVIKDLSKFIVRFKAL